MMQQDPNKVRQLFDARTWERGLSYARQGRVLAIRHDAEGTIASSVRGSGGKTYRQTIFMSAGKPVFRGHCSCPVGSHCKHLAAVCYQVSLQGSGNIMSAKASVSNPQSSAIGRPSELPPSISQWLNLVERASNSGNERLETWPANVRDRLLYILDENAGGRLTVETMKTSLLKTGAYSTKVTRYDTSRLNNIDFPKFIRPEDLRITARIRLLGLAPYSGYYTTAMAPEPGEIFSLLEMIASTGRGRWKQSNGPALFMGNERQGFFRWETQADCSQKLVLLDGQGKRLHALITDPSAFIDIESGEIGQLVIEGVANLLPALLRAPVLAPEHLAEVTQALSSIKISEIPQPVRLATEIRQGQNPTPLLKLFSTRASRDDYRGWGSQSVRLPTMRLGFDYDGHIVEGGPGGEERFLEDGKAVTFLRDRRAEEGAYHRLEQAGARYLMDIVERPSKDSRSTDLYFPDPYEETYDEIIDLEGNALEFMATVAPALRAEGWQIEVAPDWPFPFYDGPVEIRAGAVAQANAAHNDWFSFGLQLVVDGHRTDLVPTILQLLDQLDFLDPDEPDWEDTVGAILEGLKLYPQMEDGRFVSLDATSLAPMLRVFLSAVGLFDGFHRAEAGRVQDVVDALEGCQVQFDGGPELLTLGRRLQALGNTSAEVDPPSGFHGALRPYQSQGYGWLLALEETGFGGILADDMGLGKTIQTLAFLASCYAGKEVWQKPTLLVVPTSLVHAWRRQAALFAPGLNVLALHGPNRKKDFDSVDDYHLVITTYALLHRDSELLTTRRWERVILDEAQNAKNPASTIAKAIRALDTRMRLALTGTPMENSLMDLWSLYDWLVPGLLGDRKSFRTRFLIPIEKHGDMRAQQMLNARIKPFVLRRTKQQVAIDLPEKSEITDLVPLGERQSSLYEAVRLAMDERVRRTIAEKGLAASHITILDALLKLRQICCDPALLKQNDKKTVTESAKRERLIELLANIVGEGRRVLVFSQFVEMLDLIEADVRDKGWGYTRLTGSTTNRDEVVDGFQNGDIPIFLISLKAGGVGLTLTAADTVILYDPWWNPAVERQAMDRAHRIGQERKVFVYRLIAEGSVEQAISNLQERKQAVADALFEGGEGNSFTFDEEDISVLLRPLEAG